MRILNKAVLTASILIFSACEKEIIVEFWPDGSAKRVDNTIGEGLERKVIRSTWFYENGQTAQIFLYNHDDSLASPPGIGKWVYQKNGNLHLHQAGSNPPDLPNPDSSRFEASAEGRTKFVYRVSTDLKEGIRQWNITEKYYYDSEDRLYREELGAETHTFPDLLPALNSVPGLRQYLEGEWRAEYPGLGTLGHYAFSARQVRIISEISNLPESPPGLTGETELRVYDYFRGLKPGKYPVSYGDSLNFRIKTNRSSESVIIAPITMNELTMQNGIRLLRVTGN